MKLKRTDSDRKIKLKFTFILGHLFVMTFCILNMVEAQAQKTATQSSKTKVQKFLFYKSGFDPANRSGDDKILEFDQKIFELFRTEMTPNAGDISEREESLRAPFEGLADQILAKILGPIGKVNPQQVELMLGFGSHGGRGYLCHGPGGIEQELYGSLWTELLKLDQVLSELGLQKVTFFVTIVSCYSGSSIWGLDRLFRSELGLKFKNPVILFNSSQENLETYSHTTLSHLESAKKWMNLVGSDSRSYARWKSKFTSPWERLIYFLSAPWRESLDHHHKPQVYHIRGAQLLKVESLKEMPFANDLVLEHRFSFLNDPKYDYYAHFSLMRTLFLTLPETQPFLVLFDVRRAGGTDWLRFRFQPSDVGLDAQPLWQVLKPQLEDLCRDVLDYRFENGCLRILAYFSLDSQTALEAQAFFDHKVQGHKNQTYLNQIFEAQKIADRVRRGLPWDEVFGQVKPLLNVYFELDQIRIKDQHEAKVFVGLDTSIFQPLLQAILLGPLALDESFYMSIQKLGMSKEQTLMFLNRIKRGVELLIQYQGEDLDLGGRSVIENLNLVRRKMPLGLLAQKIQGLQTPKCDQILEPFPNLDRRMREGLMMKNLSRFSR